MTADQICAAAERRRGDDSSYDAIASALFETYECIYDIDAETSCYQCYYESDSYSTLKITGSGKDFFKELAAQVPRVIHPEDCRYVLEKLDRQTLLRALESERYYTLVYRLLIADKSFYYKARATASMAGGRLHILLGVRDVDETIRHERAHEKALASMYQKEKNHLEAILASAAGYMEVNLTQNLILERSRPSASEGSTLAAPFPAIADMPCYSDLIRWRSENQVIKNRERYAAIGGRDYLLSCFAKGEKRASVSYSTRSADGGEQPCKEVFYLYRDEASGDVMSFCVIYDLTERQRREKELRDLESALQMSRIRNFTSQMQPHFLYNALASIQEIVLDDPVYASALIGDFTTHLRSCIHAMADDSPIPFSEELANIKAYAAIEKMRFGKKLEIRYDVPVTDFPVLPLSVQPLVENAIRHGIYERGARGGSVTVRTREIPDCWFVEVEDDGVGFDVSVLQNGAEAGKKGSAGLKNIRFRLEKVMRASVAIQSVPESGTKVKITIPKGESSESDYCR